MFDLPSVKVADKKEYTKFRKFLINDGYEMVQYSIYSRFCRNHTALEKHKNRVICHKPLRGEVKFLVITEKQYLSMHTEFSGFSDFELKVGANPIVEV